MKSAIAKRIRWIAVLCLLCFATLGTAQPYRLGISVGAIEYATRAFANMFAMDARVWNPGTANAAPVDALGMPTTDCDIYTLDGWFAQNVARTLPFNGTYRLIFNGQADVFTSSGTIRNRAYDPATNVTTADLVITEPYPTIILYFRNTRRTAASAVNTGLTGLKLMRPTTLGGAVPYAPTTTFTTEYLAVHNRGELLRSMDFVATNGNIQSNWSDRNVPANLTYYSGQDQGYWWQGKGAPWEHFIELCNLLNKDAWINVPALATDDYVRELAHLLRTRLSPNRRIYLEYTNEVWNFAFPTHNQVAGLARTELENDPNSSLNFDGLCIRPDGSIDSGIAVPRFWARRTMEIADIFRAEFGAAAMHTGANPRIFPLFETQGAWQHWIWQGLTFLDRYYNNRDGHHVDNPRPVADILWGAGGSGYLHAFPEATFNNPNATVDDIFAGYDASWDAQYAAMVPSSHWAAAFGLKRVAYEAGIAAFEYGPAQAASIAAQTDPRIRDAYRRCADEFFRAGGEIYVHFLGIDHRYGLHTRDAAGGPPTTHKRQAFDELLAAPSRPEPTIGHAIPGTINAGRYGVSSDGWSTGGNDNPVNLQGAYDWRSYTIRSTLPRTIQLRLTASAGGGQADVFVNDRLLGRVDLAAGVPSVRLQAAISRGVSAIRVQRVSGSFWLQTLQVDSPPVVALTVTPTTVAGGNAASATVTIDQPAPAGGTMVALQSNTAVATVPASVVVPAGSTTTTFDVATSAVAGPVTARIRATLGVAQANANLTVRPVGVRALTLSPTEVPSGEKSTATVTLEAPAPAAGVTIALKTSSAAATVPASVTVPAGRTSTTFPVTGNLVVSPTNVTVTASANGVARTAILAIRPVSIQALTVSPATVLGGSATVVTAKVTLASAAPADVTVGLASNRPSAATLPATVVIPKGRTQASVAVSTSPVAADTDVAFTAKLGASSKTATLRVKTPAVKSISLSPTSVPGGSSSVVRATVTLTGRAPASGAAVMVKSSLAAAAVPGTVTVPAGATSATFSVTTRAVPTTVTGTISATRGGVTKTASLTVRAPELSAVGVSPRTVVGGSATVVTGSVRLATPAPAGGLCVYLGSSSSAASVPTKVIVEGGATTATFAVTHRRVTASTTVTIRASLNGVAKTTSLNVQP